MCAIEELIIIIIIIIYVIVFIWSLESLRKADFVSDVEAIVYE